MLIAGEIGGFAATRRFVVGQFCAGRAHWSHGSGTALRQIAYYKDRAATTPGG